MSEFTTKNIIKNYYGHDDITITDEDIKKLKSGKKLYTTVQDEYSISLKYKKKDDLYRQTEMLDKIKKAREEIDDLDRHFDNDYFSSNRDSMFKCSEVLAILDKLIESEVENERKTES